jgi:hypothetical protein
MAINCGCRGSFALGRNFTATAFALDWLACIAYKWPQDEGSTRSSPPPIVRTTLLVVAALIIGCGTGRCETTNSPLTFHIVSEQEIKGGRFIDTTNLSKLGYIAVKPDLVITNLVDVYPTKDAKFAIMVDAQGKETKVPNRVQPSVTIQLTTHDAKQFTALTERAVGKKLLIMLGGRPLVAPEVVSPIEGPYVAIWQPADLGVKKLEDDLKKLVR